MLNVMVADYLFYVGSWHVYQNMPYMVLDQILITWHFRFSFVQTYTTWNNWVNVYWSGNIKHTISFQCECKTKSCKTTNDLIQMTENDTTLHYIHFSHEYSLSTTTTFIARTQSLLLKKVQNITLIISMVRSQHSIHIKHHYYIPIGR